MDVPVCTDGIPAHSAEKFHRGSLADSHLGSQIADGRCESHPDDILYIYIVTEDCFFVIVNIYDTYQSVTVLSEIIYERRVLPHGGITVGRIVAWCLIVSKEYDDTFAYHFL